MRKCEVCDAPATTSEVSVVDNQRHWFCSELHAAEWYEAATDGLTFCCMKPEDECECPDGGWPLRLSRGTLRQWPQGADVATVKLKAEVL